MGEKDCMVPKSATKFKNGFCSLLDCLRYYIAIFMWSLHCICHGSYARQTQMLEPVRNTQVSGVASNAFIFQLAVGVMARGGSELEWGSKVLNLTRHG